MSTLRYGLRSWMDDQSGYCLEKFGAKVPRSRQRKEVSLLAYLGALYCYQGLRRTSWTRA